MGDLKRTCPACDSWTSAVGIAFRDGDPCPYCGLPAETAELIDAARERGMKKTILEKLAAAEIRATKAEAELAFIQGVHSRALRVLNENPAE